MKKKDNKNKDLDKEELYKAILSLNDRGECREFFEDLCTPAELEAMTDRWSVVAYLKQGLAYRKIYELTGISVTTIGRVARTISLGNGGYNTALDRVLINRN
ncbi:MAG: hypothetical protein CBC38_00395 [Gammaproteobacteria bacterium TMED78]|nr:MAG: hypothetical protein CBC38_00395 [Gammaproteobacteria bacterium TMED78]|tara:strand:- start:23005 stop:23310 length:306 start_codon:yes stop_codon:yes gene_type:complete